jgi:cell division protease FtsH
LSLHQKQPSRSRELAAKTPDNNKHSGQHKALGEQEPDPLIKPPYFDANAILIALFFFFIYSFFQLSSGNKVEELAYSEFKSRVIAGQVSDITMKGLAIKGNLVDGKRFSAVIPAVEDSGLLTLLDAHQVKVDVNPDQSPVWLQLLMGFLPWLMILLFFVYSGRALQNKMGGAGGAKGMFGFSTSRARRFAPDPNSFTFEDVAGLDNAKQDLAEIIDYLKHPEHFQSLGAKMPKGVLLMGPPGTGKTLLAKATANEAGVPFYSVSGSEFIEMYVGVGASRVRDMFTTARKDAPALIFIDEIDSVGRIRGGGMGGGNDEREQTLNQILAEMDGFDASEAVVVLAATNRPDVLDPALMRPGRFDRKVTLDLPQRAARRQLLAVHTRHSPLADDVDLDEVAAMTVGFSGADISNLVNEAALRAARHQAKSLSQDDFRLSRDKVIMGGRRDDLLNPSERGRIACHEAGHAITAYYCPHSDPVQKVSIVPRGQALGMTEQQPVEDRHNVDEAYLKERLAILMGGRCAEKLCYDSLSSGASDDLKQATRLARKMVAQWGMSPTLGPVGYQVGEEHPFLGRELTEHHDISEHTAQLLDQEVRVLLVEAEQACTALLERHRASLDAVVARLLEHETIEHDEFESLLVSVAAE